jgi:hypothetical protein
MPGSLLLVGPGRHSLQHDWSSFLSEGETIDSRSWTVSPTGPTLTNDLAEVVYVELDAEHIGKIFAVTETVVTNMNVTDSRSIILRCDLT